MNIIFKILNRIYNKIYPNTRNQKITDNYLGNPISSEVEGNRIICELIKENKPFCIGRIGSTELATITNYIEINKLNNKPYNFRNYLNIIKGWSPIWRDNIRLMIHQFSGVYPTDDLSLNNFSKIYIDAISKLDVLGVWYNYYEDVISQDYCPNAKLIPLKSIEPYYFPDPWGQFLENKKVLVIHPFKQSIINQHKVFNQLFDNKLVHPNFELIVIQAVQTIAKNQSAYESWFDAFEYMKSEIDKIDFDIALIGAGAYGLPLAAYVKDQGKQAIHMGGALQIFFGIKGARWDNNLNVNKFYNDYWVRPLPDETPSGFKKVEEGCYW